MKILYISSFLLMYCPTLGPIQKLHIKELIMNPWFLVPHSLFIVTFFTKQHKFHIIIITSFLKSLKIYKKQTIEKQKKMKTLNSTRSFRHQLFNSTTLTSAPTHKKAGECALNFSNSFSCYLQKKIKHKLPHFKSYSSCQSNEIWKEKNEIKILNFIVFFLPRIYEIQWFLW